MLARCFRSDTRPLPGRTALIALALVLLPTVVSPAPQPVRKVNECNSEITIGQAPSMIAEGQLATVTLTVTNTDARDNMDNGIAQVFDMVTYTGHCESGAVIPCVPAVANQFSYQGNLGGSCPGVVVTDMMNGVVEFDFVPDLSLMTVTPPIPPAPVSCTITFDVTYMEDGSYPAQATTGGLCQGGAFSSDTTVTTFIIVDPIPTMGEVALAMLALLLVAAYWLTLRRRKEAFRA